MRDDMFQDKDRTKFFDFMMPIIPVINSSNSKEKLLNIIKSNKYDISEDLIEDISLFIDDMRLLYNIMNEYHIYSKNLNSNLIQDRLLSMIVFKNIYPNDFTKLSQNDGELYKVIRNKNNYISEKTKAINEEISQIKQKIINTETAKINDLKELRLIYISKLIEKIQQTGQAFKSFFFRNQEYNINQATNDDIFNALTTQSRVDYVFYQSSSHRTSINYNFNTIETEVNSNLSYKEREKLVLSKVDLEQYKKDIEKLEQEKNNIKKYKLMELISSKEIDIISESQNRKELINVLLRNGYINEDYLDYISIFYEGSLSKNDHQFLINVKTQTETDFEYSLQKKENLIKRINEFDFEKSYILNYDLIDFLLSSNSFQKKRDRIFNQLIDESDSSLKFIDGFIDYTANIELFIKLLCKDWDRIWFFIEHESNYPKEKVEKYFKLVIEYAEVEDVKNIFINSKSKIFDNKDFLLIIKNTGKLKEIIKKLNVKFSILDESSPQELLDYVYDNNNYSLNIKVVRFFLKIKEKLVENAFDTKNYSTIKQSKLDKLIDYIDDNIDEYITSIYLDIEANTSETDEYYIQLLNNENISDDNKIKVIAKVETLINNINDIEDYELIKPLLAESRILPTWSNLVNIYVQSENEFISEMTSFVNIKENAKELSKTRIKTDTPNEETVKAFLISLLLNDDIENENYSSILSSIPYIYNSLSFENLSFEKVELLIKKNKLTTNAINFELLKNNFENLHILLIENNPNSFIKDIDSFEIENEELLGLLKSKTISIQLKEKIIESYETAIFTLDSELLKQIGKLLLENSYLNIDREIIMAVGTDSNLSVLDKIKIFNKWNMKYNKEEISTFLISLKKPYSSIAENGKRPLLDNNEINRELIAKLGALGYISKYTIEKRKGIRISTFKNK